VVIIIIIIIIIIITETTEKQADKKKMERKDKVILPAGQLLQLELPALAYDPETINISSHRIGTKW
jgi:hypothetical protein